MELSKVIEIGNDVMNSSNKDLVDSRDFLIGEFDKTKEIKQAYRIIGTIYDTIFSVKDSEKFKEYLRNYKH